MSASFTTDKHLIGLYSESVIDGKTTSLFQILSLHDTPFGRWFDTDNPDVVNGFPGGAHINFTWLEEYKGEKGVIAIENTTGAEGFFTNRKYWNALYPKEHYKRGTKLVFRMMAEGHTRIDYLAEYPVWTPGCGQNGIASEWTDYAFDFDVIYNNFEGFANYAIFYILGQPNTLYISDIFVVVEEELENVNLLQGSSYNVASHASFEGCDITECEVTYKGTKVSVNGTTFLADKAGTYQVYVSGYDHMGLFFENTFNVISNAADTWHNFDTADSAAHLLYGSTYTTWLESYEGAAGVLKVTQNDFGFVGADGTISWQPAFDAAAYKGATGLKFRMKLEGANWYQLTAFATGNAANAIIYRDQQSTDGWVDFVWNIDVKENYDILKGMYFIFWFSESTGVAYIDSITAVFPEPSTEPEGTWYGFSSADSASNLVLGKANTSWLESYEGASGVIKLSAFNDYPFYGYDYGVTWQPVSNAAAYEGATGLKFRVRCDGTTGYQLVVCAYGTVLKQLYDGHTQDGWVEFIWDIDVAANYDALKGMYFITSCWGNTGAIYIDSITAVFPE